MTDHIVVNLSASLATLTTFFHPRVVAEVNNVVVKLTKIQVEFIYRRGMSTRTIVPRR